MIGRKSVRQFSFNVPSAESELQLQNGELKTTVGYSGSITINGSTNDLHELALELHRIPEWIGIREARTRIVYERRKTDTSEPVLPVWTDSMMKFDNGVVSRNRTEYESCREFTAESTIHGGDGAVPAAAVQSPAPLAAAIPAGMILDLRLKEPVQVEQIATGDLVSFRIEGVTAGDHGLAQGDEVIGRVIHFRQVGTLRRRLESRRTATSVGFELLSIGSGGRHVPIKASPVSLNRSGRSIRDLYESRAGNRLILTWSGKRNLGRDFVFRWIAEN